MNDNIYENSMLGAFGIYHEGFNFLPSRINIGYSASSPVLSSAITIKARNMMFGKFLVKTPTRQTQYLLPVQDAFVRKNAATMNYAVGELNVGSSSSTGDVFRSFLSWDLTQLKGNSLIITKAIIHFKLLQSGSYNFNINEVLSAWSEHGVTWKGQPPKGNLVATVQSDPKVDEILVDIIALAREWYKDGLYNYGIELSAVDETLDSIMRLGGRETTGLETSLELQYFDPNGVYDEENAFQGSIIIEKQDDILLNSSVQIKNHFLESNLPGSIEVRNPETMYTQITIHKDNLPSSIRITNIFNLPSSVQIERTDASGLNSNAIIRNNLHGSVSISNKLDLSSSIIVNKQILTGNLEISGTKDLTGALQIPNASNLFSSIAIENPQISANINISEVENLFSNVTLRKVLWMKGKIKIPNTLKLPSYIQIGTYENLNSSIEITNGINTNNLKSSIKIIRQEEKSIKGNITIQKVKEIPGSITICSNNLGYGHITIMRQETLQLPSAVTVHDRYPKITGKIDIRAPWYSDLEGNIIIRNGNEEGNDDTGYIV